MSSLQSYRDSAAFVGLVNDVLFELAHVQLDDVPSVVRTVTRRVIGRLDLEACAIFLLDANGRRLHQVAAYSGHDDEPSVPLEFDVGEGVVGTVARTGVTEIVSDVHSDVRFRAVSHARASEIAVPIKYDGAVIGVLGSESEQRDRYTRDHQTMFETLAGVVAGSIVAAQTLERVRVLERAIEALPAPVAVWRGGQLLASSSSFNSDDATESYPLGDDAVLTTTKITVESPDA